MDQQGPAPSGMVPPAHAVQSQQQHHQQHNQQQQQSFQQHQQQMIHQQHQQHQHIRRLSEPAFAPPLTNGAGSHTRRSLPPKHNVTPHAQAQGAPIFGFLQAQPQLNPNNPMGQNAGHPPMNQPHSVLASMDLMSPSSSSSINHPSNQGNFHFPPPPKFQSSQQKQNSFSLSSHHTSHTAAAGDLLSMSRRALDPISAAANDETKKRSATMSDVNENGNHVMSPSQAHMMNGANNQMGQQHQLHLQQQQQQQQQHHVMMSNFPSPSQPLLFSSTSAGMVSVSTDGISVGGSVGGTGTSSTGGFLASEENDDSYQHHRTIRRCRRSDSFEMMDDGS